MADQRIGWRFCPRCGVPWPMNRPDKIYGRIMICGNCDVGIPDIDGWMEDCRSYQQETEAAVERVRKFTTALGKIATFMLQPMAMSACIWDRNEEIRGMKKIAREALEFDDE
jgi:hypothetical protein